MSARKTSTGHAMMAVSSSLDKVAVALSVNPGGPSSPQRKSEAIRSITKMDAFSKEQKIRLMQLIRSDTSVADAFLAIDDPELVVDFMLAELEAAS